jgi:hypothetical protein
MYHRTEIGKICNCAINFDMTNMSNMAMMWGGNSSSYDDE